MFMSLDMLYKNQLAFLLVEYFMLHLNLVPVSKATHF